HLYVGNHVSNNISVFQIAADGSLAQIPGSPFAAGAFLFGIAMDHTGRFLYAANSLDNTLSAYTVSADGSLSAVSGSPYPTPRFPYAVAVDPFDRFVYVTSLGTEAISTFMLNSSSGSLAPSTVFPLASNTGAFGIVIDPTGRFAY